MKYLTFPKPFRLFYTASHSFSGRVLKAKCSVPISGNIIRTVAQPRMRDRSTTKILSGCRRMTIAYHSWCFPFFTHLTFRLRLSSTGDETTAKKRENDDRLKELFKPMLLPCSAAASLRSRLCIIALPSGGAISSNFEGALICATGASLGHALARFP